MKKQTSQLNGGELPTRRRVGFHVVGRRGCEGKTGVRNRMGHQDGGGGGVCGGGGAAGGTADGNAARGMCSWKYLVFLKSWLSSSSLGQLQ